MRKGKTRRELECLMTDRRRISKVVEVREEEELSAGPRHDGAPSGLLHLLDVFAEQEQTLLADSRSRHVQELLGDLAGVALEEGGP